MASKRGYLTQEELAEYANIIINDSTEADDQISQAEEQIDSFVGFQEKHIIFPYFGKISSGGASVVTLDPLHQNVNQQNYLLNCWIEIVGGTGNGQRRKIISQLLSGIIIVETAFTTALDSTSYYKIWQLGKFPRCQDVHFDSINVPNQYFKSIPEAVKRAVAAQVEYMIQMGPIFFATDASDKTSESIGDYSYTKKANVSGDQLIAPKAKMLLKGIKNRVGTIVT